MEGHSVYDELLCKHVCLSTWECICIPNHFKIMYSSAAFKQYQEWQLNDSIAMAPIRIASFQLLQVHTSR